MLRATLKSLLARKLRLLLSGLAVVLGVMFVSGAFVLTDTLGRSFDSLFAQAFESTDVYVSSTPSVSANEFEGSGAGRPLPAELVQTVAANPKVAEAVGTIYADGARLIGSNGKVVTSFGAPQAGQNWVGENGPLELRSGHEPRADDQIVINAGLAEAARVSVGDRVGVLTREPKREFTIVGIAGYSGGRDSLGGSNEIFFTTPVAQQLMLGERDVYTHVTAQAVEGTSAEQLRDALAGSLGMATTAEGVETEEQCQERAPFEIFVEISIKLLQVAESRAGRIQRRHALAHDGQVFIELTGTGFVKRQIVCKQPSFPVNGLPLLLVDPVVIAGKEGFER